MAEKLCQKFGNGPHALKIGKSFENKGGNSVYHSIRYDFTPKSIDKETMGVLEVKERQSVSVQLPHSDGVNQTVYKGNAETAPTKDCVLIIDHETGELTLERISNKIMVKKTRPERAGPPGANPYEVKSEPNPYEVKANPYEVKPNPYEVKPPPNSKPHNDRGPAHRTSGSSVRPNTPQQAQQKKKSPGYQLAESLSPLHSNKSSPASTSGRAPSSQPVQGYNVDSMGRPLSSSSDSNSSSDSDSDVDDPKPVKNTKPSKPSPAPSTPDLLGDLLSGEVTSRPGGTLPTARPQGKVSASSRAPPTKPRPPAPSNYPSHNANPTPPQPRPAPPPPVCAPPPSSSMPGMPDIFGDLGDDLELSDDSE